MTLLRVEAVGAQSLRSLQWGTSVVQIDSWHAQTTSLLLGHAEARPGRYQGQGIPVFFCDQSSRYWGTKMLRSSFSRNNRQAPFMITS